MPPTVKPEVLQPEKTLNLILESFYTWDAFIPFFFSFAMYKGDTGNRNFCLLNTLFSYIISSITYTQIVEILYVQP